MNKLGLAILITCVVLTMTLGGVYFFLVHQSPDIREYESIRRNWRAARTDVDEAAKKQLATRCLEVAHQHPGTIGGLSALLLAYTDAADTTAGKEAKQQLAQQIETADIDNLSMAFDRYGGP